MKKFTVQCDINGTKYPMQIYIGNPCSKTHPICYQAMWLRDNRSGIIPPEVMESFQKLQNIALENKVSFEDLCMYAFGEGNNNTPPPEKK